MTRRGALALVMGGERIAARHPAAATTRSRDHGAALLY